MRTFTTLTLFAAEMLPPSKKKLHQQPKSVQEEYIEVPGSLGKSIGNLKVAADVMFVNGILFVVSVSRGVNFTTVEYVS